MSSEPARPLGPSRVLDEAELIKLNLLLEHLGTEETMALLEITSASMISKWKRRVSGASAVYLDRLAKINLREVLPSEIWRTLPADPKPQESGTPPLIVHNPYKRPASSPPLSLVPDLLLGPGGSAAATPDAKDPPTGSAATLAAEAPKIPVEEAIQASHTAVVEEISERVEALSLNQQFWLTDGPQLRAENALLRGALLDLKALAEQVPPMEGPRFYDHRDAQMVKLYLSKVLALLS